MFVSSFFVAETLVARGLQEYTQEHFHCWLHLRYEPYSKFDTILSKSKYVKYSIM